MRRDANAQSFNAEIANGQSANGPFANRRGPDARAACAGLGNARGCRMILRSPAFAPLALAGLLVAAGSARAATAQPVMNARPLGGGGGVVVVPNDPLLDPDSPEAKALAALNREKRAIERELRIIRTRHFGSMRNTERRQIGLRKLRAYTDRPALLAMTELFDDEAEDVRTAILDHFASLASDDGDATLAWEAVHGEDGWYRTAARDLFVERVAERGEPRQTDTTDEARDTDEADEASAVDSVPDQARLIIAEALRGTDDAAAVAGAKLAAALRLYEFIPLMATAQAAVQPGGGGDRTGDLAWILVGQQTAFIADLQPVVANSAVAFDPQIGVVSEGTLLRVHDAAVTVYRTEIHRDLVAMTSAAWGRPTGSLGYDAEAWAEWYRTKFAPSRQTEPDEGGDPEQRSPGEP